MDCFNSRQHFCNRLYSCEICKLYNGIRNGIVKSRNEVLDKWSKTEFVKSTNNIEAKGWLFDVLLCVEKIKKEEFSLDEVYAFEGYL